MERIESDATIFGENETVTKNGISFDKTLISLPSIYPDATNTNEG
jgi:hypothetical protein